MRRYGAGMPVVPGAGSYAADDEPHYAEQFRSADLSVGTYSLPAGSVDDQSPHTEDEIYVVTAGRASFVDEGGRLAVAAGDTIFVAAGREHRFVDIEEDLTLVVVFAPPYRSRQA